MLEKCEKMKILALDNKTVLLAITQFKKRKMSTYRLLKLLYSQHVVSLFSLVYTYFRWLDDLIDLPSSTDKERQETIRRQKYLFTSFYSDEKQLPHDLNQQERMLQLVIKYDIRNGFCLQKYISQMIKALEFDVERRYQIVSKNVLNDYSRRLGQSYTGVFTIITVGDQLSPDVYAQLGQGGVAAHLVHILRDLHEDISYGYYNFGKEDAKKYGMSINQISDAAIETWAYEVSKKAWVMFNAGFRGLKSVRSTRYHLLYNTIVAPYFFLLKKIESNNYKLNEQNWLSNKEKIHALAWAMKTTIFTRL